jgi:hypothetical protein
VKPSSLKSVIPVIVYDRNYQEKEIDMELNKKLLVSVLSQIKAYMDVVVFQDSSDEGCLDILYMPKNSELLMAIHKMTFRKNGTGTDLFDDTPDEKLRRAVPIRLSRLRDALRDSPSCVFSDGHVNGIRVEFDMSEPDDSKRTSVFASILNWNKNLLATSEPGSDFATVSLGKDDWAYAVSECSKFVSDDPTRYSMNGICFDFFQGGKDFVYIVATDGRKLILLKHAAGHEDLTDETGQFIVAPACLLVPRSEYSSVTLWLSSRSGRLSISTADYSFEGAFLCIDGKFPNYPMVIPEIGDKTEWFTLCDSSFRVALDSVKSMMKEGPAYLYLNAENPESLKIILEDKQTSLEVEGTASRPMLLHLDWNHLSGCLFRGQSLTKFYWDGYKNAILAHDAKAGKGVTLDVTKVFMPLYVEEPGADEFGILKGGPLERDPPESREADEEVAES